MLCRDVMKTNLQYIKASDSVLAAAQRMREANVGFLPVCDSDNNVIGTVTDRDIVVRCVAMGRSPISSVEGVMSLGVVACLPTEDVSRAQTLMAVHKKSRIVCCDPSGKLMGVISLSDLAAQTDGPATLDTLRKVAAREAHA